LTRWKGHRVGQLSGIVAGARNLSLRQQPLIRTTYRHRRENCNRPPAIGDLDTLPSLNIPQQLARALPKLANTNAHHVLVVAHSWLNIPALPYAALWAASGMTDALEDDELYEPDPVATEYPFTPTHWPCG
jgi:hypothetical protein